MNAKAAVLRALGEPPRIEDLTLPHVLEPGQVRVRVHAAGICGAQIREISGSKGPDPYLPHLLGHEGAGVVENVGVGVTTVKPDDHVVCHWRKGSGCEGPPPVYIDEEGNNVGAGPVAVWAEQAVVSENRVTVIPKDISFKEAALLGCGVTTGLGVVTREALLLPGQSILVAGVGGVGLSVVQWASMVSAHPILAIDRSSPRLKLALQFGATATAVVEKIWGSVSQDDQKATWLPPGGVDVFVDCTGHPRIIAQGHLWVRPGGRTILVGQPAHGEPVTFGAMSRYYTGKTLLDSQGGQTVPDEDIPRCIALRRVRKLDLEHLIGKAFHFLDIAGALAHHNSEAPGRTLLVMS